MNFQLYNSYCVLAIVNIYKDFMYVADAVNIYYNHESP